MKTIFIETCIEILKKESNPTLQNIVSLAEKELSEIKKAVEQGLHPTGGSLPPSEHWTTPEGMPTPKVNLVPPTSG